MIGLKLTITKHQFPLNYSNANSVLALNHSSGSKHFTIICVIRYSTNFWWGKILMDTDFKYLMRNILTDGHCLSPYTCKCCLVFKQHGRLNFDGLAGKCQKHQNFVLYGILVSFQISLILFWATVCTSKSSCCKNHELVIKFSGILTWSCKFRGYIKH